MNTMTNEEKDGEIQRLTEQVERLVNRELLQVTFHLSEDGAEGFNSVASRMSIYVEPQGPVGNGRLCAYTYSHHSSNHLADFLWELGKREAEKENYTLRQQLAQSEARGAEMHEVLCRARKHGTHPPECDTNVGCACDCVWQEVSAALALTPSTALRLHDAELAEPFQQQLTACEDVLRKLAAYVGAGGFSEAEFSPNVFEEKIRWGIAHLSEAFQSEQWEWVKATFPDEKAEGAYTHLHEEVRELGEAITDPDELADCFLLIQCIASHGGVNLMEAARAKFEKCKARKWVKTEAGYRHEKGETRRSLEGGEGK